MDVHPRELVQAAARLGAAAQNALEVARFGGLETGEEPAPFDVVEDTRMYKLRRYLAEQSAPDASPVVLVPPLMLTAEVYDVAPAASAVRILADHGVDPWVIDFGAPERQTGGLERTLADHVLAVSEVVDSVRKLRGRDVHLGGYSQGGMFCYQAAAYRRSEGLGSVITFGSPVDTLAAMPFGLPAEAAKGIVFIAERVLAGRSVPAWVSRTSFRLMDPVKSLRQRIDFLRQLHNREALLPREGQRRFLEGEGWVAWPGPALLDFMEQFVAHNRMVSGGFVIEDRLVTLADITCPLLCFVGELDEIAPPAVVRAVNRAAPRAEAYEVSQRAGHFGLVVGSKAATGTWPTVAAWARWRDGLGERPEAIGPLGEERPEAADGHPGVHVGYGLELAAGVGLGAARSTVQAASRSAGTIRAIADDALNQLPRLARLERVQGDARISIGLLLDEQARKAGNDVFFLFEDRGHTYGDAKRRVDAVVRGLIASGVRQGEHIGVLMETRPSALAVIAALSRLGAIAVLMRPDGSIAREAELGQVTRIIADPERAQAARKEAAVPVLVLGGGGGGEPRDLGFGVTDMERIDPDEVTLPAWYVPNPGRAQELAFILFTGRGDGTRVNRITNRRWAVSAFGTASAAALSASDTVYCVTPIHHASAVLTSIGGAVAGGSRLALATRFEPSTFWDEVRRYGVTIVSYTWTLVRELLEAPRDPAERHHPVRLFIGSGMPKGLWRRTLNRFAPAGVLEFYASTEGEAVLVNLSGEKIGAKGRRLPGSAQIRIAAYDAEAGRLIEGHDGFAIECAADEVGMLLARVDTHHGLTPGTALRGVFAKNDAWLATGDLFRRDLDGDYWHIDDVSALIRTADGVVPSVPIEDALGDLDAIDLVVAHGVPGESDGYDIAVASVTLRKGRRLDAKSITAALARLDANQQPAVVRVVPEIPLTTWFRPIKSALRNEPLPGPGKRGAAWYHDPATGRYRAKRQTAARRSAAPRVAAG
jgi:putative long chain acyl-CoA synthase